MNIVEAIKEPELFRPFLADKDGELDSWGNWLSVLRVTYGLPTTRSRHDLIRQCTGRDPALLVLDFYGNPAAVQKAMDNAIPNREKLQALEEREARIEKQLASVGKRTDQLLDAIADNTVPREVAKRKLEGFAQEESKLNSQLLQLRSERASVPSPELVKLTADHFVTRLGKTLRYSNAKKVIERQRLLTPDALTFKEKRDLVKEAFQGVALDGKPAGVYIFAIDDQADHRHKRWRFEMLGNVALDGIFGKTACVNESAAC